jgi:hypothetical protein
MEPSALEAFPSGSPIDPYPDVIRMGRILEAREYFEKLYPPESKPKLWQVSKTHQVVTVDRFKPVTTSLYPAHVVDFVADELTHTAEFNVAGDSAWGGQFLFDSAQAPKITSMFATCNGAPLDSITDASMGAWDYHCTRSATGMYILENPFWFKHIYTPLYGANMRIKITIQTTNPIKHIKYVYKTVYKPEYMRAIPITPNFGLVRCHSTQSTTVHHNINYPLEIYGPAGAVAKVAIEELVFLLSPSDLANIEAFSIQTNKDMIYDEIPVDGYITPLATGIHVSFRIPIEDEPDTHQPTGFVLSGQTQFTLHLVDPIKPVTVTIAYKFINMVLYDCSDALVLRYAK